MPELAISPLGHLIPRESDSNAESVPKSLLEAFRRSSAEGMLHSAGEANETTLPRSFDFVRSLARLYLTHLCRAASGERGASVPELPPPAEELARVVLAAPPMEGLEYLNVETVSNWWRDLDTLVRREIGSHLGGPEAYLRERNPKWRLVGRVTFHLAENKRDPQHPFAFLATFANGMTAQGTVRHEPLGRALQHYAGAKDRTAMLQLLQPISKAAESSELVRRLVDSGEVYHPLAWSPREAYEFLRAIPILESSGLIVRVPDWWHAQKPPRPRANATINSKNSQGIGLDDTMEFSATVSLDGESLTDREIEELLQSSGGLVPLRGKWVEVDPEKLRAALDHWRRIEKQVRAEGLTFYEGMRLLSGANLAERTDDKTETAVREWTGLTAGPELEQILRELRAPSAADELPPGLHAELRPYQRTGFSWLRFVARLGLGGCLADDMGLGKTLQVIALLLDLKRDGERKPSLLVVPASLIANWKSELAKFAPTLRYAVIHPSEERGDRPPDSIGDFDLLITTYGMLARTPWMQERLWRLAILDEAQAIKNSGTKQTRAVKDLTATARVAMTGTPVENRLSDLWSLFDFLNPGLLGTAKEFGSFAKRLEQQTPPSYEPLRNLVRPYILRRLKTDKRVIADLPDKTEVKAYCPLSKHQAALYQKAVDDLAGQLKSSEGIRRRGIVLAQLVRLKQICNHPAQATGTQDFAADRSGKFGRLAELAEEIAARQEKVLVFTQFREITDPLSDFLADKFGRTGLVLHGGTAVKKRKEFVDQFQREEGPPFFVLSLKAGGTGLNLTAASHVIHFDRWWNPAVENQATDRAFRIGQKRNVMVHKFVCRGTIEERIDEMIERKVGVAREAIGGADAGETLLTEMDDVTLLEFVKLDLHRAVES